jgi:translation initiation factor 4G
VKVNEQKMHPETDKNKDHMLEMFEGKRPNFFFPLLKLKKELVKYNS